MNPARSVGEANFCSRTSRSINSKGTSIVRRLASRCLIGHSLKIQIHQHIGSQLHLVWHVNGHYDYKSMRCLEREFRRYGDLHDFCKELKNGGFEGLCDCVYTHSFEWMKDKIEPCHLEESTHSYLKETHVLRSWERTSQQQNQRRNLFQCMCPVSSSYVVEWN